MLNILCQNSITKSGGIYVRNYLSMIIDSKRKHNHAFSSFLWGKEIKYARKTENFKLF
jgi:hypothetical protein